MRVKKKTCIDIILVLRHISAESVQYDKHPETNERIRAHTYPSGYSATTLKRWPFVNEFGFVFGWTNVCVKYQFYLQNLKHAITAERKASLSILTLPTKQRTSYFRIFSAEYRSV